MAYYACLIQCFSRMVWLFVGLIVVFGSISLTSPAHGRRMICWQAIMKCQGEGECNYAYGQYVEACSSIISRDRHRCPSHCISALIQLNHTKNGPALEDCDCAQDERCRATKRAIEPCLPRTSGVLGCTEARRQCDRDPRCSTAMRNYLIHCGKLFNGIRCTDECRAVIDDMRYVPKAALLNDCVCDGMERPICEAIKDNMARLCFGSDFNTGSGGSDDDDDYEDYNEDPVIVDYASKENGGCLLRPLNVLTLMACILLLFPFL